MNHDTPDNASSAARASHIEAIRNIIYAQTPQRPLMLDLFIPRNVTRPPLVVSIHGGGWRSQDRTHCRVPWLPQHGIALATIDYRLSHEATFPAQIHDCKAAVRFLRAQAHRYGYHRDLIAALGTSSGGHLAVLLGVTAGVRDLEGQLGEHLGTDSSVHAVVDYYGATDLVERTRLQPQTTEQPEGSVYQLLGGPAGKNLDLASLASGCHHVGPDAPPLLIFHGLMDDVVNPSQSIRLYQTYRRHHLPVEIVFDHAAGHGDGVFFQGPYRHRLLRFLARILAASGFRVG